MTQVNDILNSRKKYRRGYHVYVLDIKKNKDKIPPSPPEPKKPIQFDVKSDEDIVYKSNYKFNLDIEVLLNNSKKTRKAKRSENDETKRTPRRQNAWILYRRDKSASPEFKGKKSSNVSIAITKMWKEESKHVKEIFVALANLAEKRHIENYGKDYKYRPFKKIIKRRRKKVQKKTDESLNLELIKPEYFSTFLVTSPSTTSETISSAGDDDDNTNDIAFNYQTTRTHDDVNIDIDQQLIDQLMTFELQDNFFANMNNDFDCE